MLHKIKDYLLAVYRRHKSFIRYALAGVLNTAIDYIVYVLLITFTGLPTAVCQMAGYVVGISCSYITNSHWAFKNASGRQRGRIIRFVICNLISMSISMMLIHTFVDIIDLDEYVIKLPVTVGVALLNYLGYKVFVFK